MKRLLLLLLPLAVTAAGCRSPGPYERTFRPTPVASASVPDGIPAGSVPLNLSAEPEEEAFPIPDEPVIPVSSVLAYELVSPGDVTNWWSTGHVELGRSQFIGELADRNEAVSLAARLGAPVVLFHAEDLGERLVWQTEFEHRMVRDPWPPPPPRRHFHRHGPPPFPHWHNEAVPVERLRVFHPFAQTAVYLSPPRP